MAAPASCSPLLLLQHLLATFRTLKVSRMDFELNAQQAYMAVTLTCDNGEAQAPPVPAPPLRSSSAATAPHPTSLAAAQQATSCRLAAVGQRLAASAGLVKRYRLDTLDAEILQATVERSILGTCVVAEAGELNK
jgi:hypothetical protein